MPKHSRALLLLDHAQPTSAPAQVPIEFPFQTQHARLARPTPQANALCAPLPLAPGDPGQPLIPNHPDGRSGPSQNGKCPPCVARMSQRSHRCPLVSGHPPTSASASCKCLIHPASRPPRSRYTLHAGTPDELLLARTPSGTLGIDTCHSR